MFVLEMILESFLGIAAATPVGTLVDVDAGSLVSKTHACVCTCARMHTRGHGYMHLRVCTACTICTKVDM